MRRAYNSHRSRRTAGFTLIEIILVTALSALGLLIVLLGQHQLQAKARFDAAVDKTIQNIAYARNFSQSNVNFSGSGNSDTALVVGDALEFDNAHIPNFPLTEIEPIYAKPDANGNPDTSTFSNWPSGAAASDCPPSQHLEDGSECFEDFIDLPDNLTLDSANMSGATEAEIDYVNLGHGLQVCTDVGSAFAAITTACTHTPTTPVPLILKDDQGFSTTILIDPNTGYASRQ